VIKQNQKTKNDIDIAKSNFIYRIGAGILSLLALASSITFLGETSLKKLQVQKDSHGSASSIIDSHEIARLKDDTPSGEKGHHVQIYVVQPASEAILDFANEEDLERLTR
jgi:hypothetical protein